MKSIKIPKPGYLLLAILAITFVVYYGSFNYSYVNWDDDENIRINTRITEFNLTNLNYHYQHERYKSLAIWSFMAEHQFYGDSPKARHINNLLLHLANIVLVFFLTLKLSKKNKNIAIITAALFAFHPAFVEPVVWVTGRKDLLFVLFSLLSVLAYMEFLQATNRVKQYLLLSLTLILFFLAALSKIQAIALPVIYLAIDWYNNRKLSFLVFVEKIIFILFMLNIWNLLILIALLYFILMQFDLTAIIRKKRNTTIAFTVLATSLLLTMPLFIHFVIFVIKWNVYLEWFDQFQILFLYVPIFIFLVISLIFRKKMFQFLSKLKLRTMTIVLIVLIACYIAPYYSYFIYKIHDVTIQVMQLWQIKKGSEIFFTIPERFLLAGNSFFYYIKRLFLFEGQNLMIPYPLQGKGGVLSSAFITGAVWGYVLFAIMVVLVIRYFRKNKIVLLGFGWFLVNISIVMHLIPIEGRVLEADRYTYFSFIGLFFLVGLAADYFVNRKRGAIVAGVLGLVLLIMAYTTYRDKATWQNSFTLWQKALAENPENHYAMYSLALAYFAEGNDPKLAEQYLNQAIDLKPNFMYYNNRGRMRYVLGNMRGALADFDKSIALDSTSFAAFNNRGAVRQQFCDFSGALSDYRYAVALQSDYQEAISNQAKVLNLMHLDSVLFGQVSDPLVTSNQLTEFVLTTSEKLLNTLQRDKAIEYLTHAIGLFPDNPDIYEKLAVIYHMDNEFDEAKEVYDKGLQQIPDNPSLLLGRGLLFIQTGDTLNACTDLKASASKGDTDAQSLLQQFCK